MCPRPKISDLAFCLQFPRHCPDKSATASSSGCVLVAAIHAGRQREEWTCDGSDQLVDEWHLPSKDTQEQASRIALGFINQVLKKKKTWQMMTLRCCSGRWDSLWHFLPTFRDASSQKSSCSCVRSAHKRIEGCSTWYEVILEIARLTNNLDTKRSINKRSI